MLGKNPAKSVVSGNFRAMVSIFAMQTAEPSNILPT